MSSKEPSKSPDELQELQKVVHELQKTNATQQREIAQLQDWVKKADRIVASLQDIGKIFGTYKGSDGRSVPAVITAAFPRAGTVDIFVFDNSYSGGNYQLTGIELGASRGEMLPYLAELAEEEADDNFVAA